MGAPFEFAKGEGPVIHEPIAKRSQIDALRVIEPEDGLGYVLAALRLIKKELAGKVPLIGFAGAPFTLASYLIEGGKSAHFVKTKRLMYSDPESWHLLMGKLAEVVRRYLVAQVAAGADCVQLFDSWVGQLSREDYATYVMPHVANVLAGLRGLTDAQGQSIPVIHFGTGTHALLELQATAGGDVIGLDWRTPLAEGWARVGHGRAVQGNLDPTVLFAPPAVVHAHATRVLEAAEGRPGHIFNLGHGILPETPVDTVQGLVDFVHAYRQYVDPTRDTIPQ
jgi:uroporphyrinogen decarboxylase